MSSREAFTTRVMEAGGRLRVRSALNPILWLCGIVAVPGLFAISFMNGPPTWLLAVLIAPIVTAIVGFIFLLLFDRDKLQSEEYQIRKLQLEMIEEKGRLPAPTSDNQLVVKPKSLLLNKGATDE